MSKAKTLAGLLAVVGMSAALAATNDPFKEKRFNDYWEEPEEWTEDEIVPPALPDDASLVPIYVSAVQTNEYLVDLKSVNLGKDQVVRYTLVVRTSGGARNVSYEGMRCETREWKTYATVRTTAEGSVWAKTRLGQWRPVENKAVNRHHAAISKDFFCPNGSSLRSTEEGIDALRRGGHPEVPGNRR